MCTRRKGLTLDACDVSRPGFDVDRGHALVVVYYTHACWFIQLQVRMLTSLYSKATSNTVLPSHHQVTCCITFCVLVIFASFSSVTALIGIPASCRKKISSWGCLWKFPSYYSTLYFVQIENSFLALIRVSCWKFSQLWSRRMVYWNMYP